MLCVLCVVLFRCVLLVCDALLFLWLFGFCCVVCGVVVFCCCVCCSVSLWCVVLLFGWCVVWSGVVLCCFVLCVVV